MKKLFTLLLAFILFENIQAQTLILNESPENYQLYARDSENKAVVSINGKIVEGDINVKISEGDEKWKRIEFKCFRDGEVIESKEMALNYEWSHAGFSFNQKIESGLVQYKFQLTLINGSKSEICFTADSIVCGDAYIITGQSNSHASSSLSPSDNPFCRSFGVKTSYNPYTEEHKKQGWGLASGNCPGLNGVGGWGIDNPLGVGVWGMHLMEKIVEEYKVPVCVINGGSGSSSIEQNMPAIYQADLNSSFGRLIYRVHEAGLTDKIKAILWHQGETNTNDKNWWEYANKFKTLRDAWKKNFTSVEKIYLFQLHPGCGGEFQSQFRYLQQRISEAYDDVEIMSTNALPGHDGCHYTHEGYLAMAETILPLVGRDFYGAVSSSSITPPIVTRAYISDRDKIEICVEFDQDITLDQSVEIKGTKYQMTDYLMSRVKDENIKSEKCYADGNKLYITFPANNRYGMITYMPDHFYDETKVVYEGPWITGVNGIGALSFNDLRINRLASSYSSIPKEMQLYPRDKNSSAVVRIDGSVLTNGFDTALCKVYRDKKLINTLKTDLTYSKGEATFSFKPEIKAELAEYDIEIGFESKGKYFKDRVVSNIVCGDVYLINGQSNSHPTKKEAIYKNEFCRSFGKNTDYGVYNPADTTWGLASGNEVHDFHVSAWGIRLMKQLVERHKIPVCIINGGSGGSKIEYNLPNENDLLSLKSTYGRLLYRAQKAGVADHVKGLIWHQGESNSSDDENYLNYAGNFDTLYKAWKRDYASMEHVYVFQIHPGCSGGRQSEIRETQRKFAYKYNDVSTISTCGLIGHDGCHYTNPGYSQMGDWLYPLMAADFYQAKIGDAGSPDLVKAYYSKSGKEITLVFSKEVLWPSENDASHKMEDYFYLDGKNHVIEKGIAKGNKIILTLANDSKAKTIGYLPSHFYEDTKNTYQGPWIFGANGYGALSFHNYPIRAKR